MLLSEKQLPPWVSQFEKEKYNEATAEKHTLPVRKVRARWLAGRPQYAKEAVQNRLIKCGGSCSKPGRSRGWHNSQSSVCPALCQRRRKLALNVTAWECFHTIRLSDAGCWASFVYRDTSAEESTIATPSFLEIINSFQGWNHFRRNNHYWQL